MARGRSSGSSKGSLIQRPFTGGSWPKTMVRSMNSTGRRYPLVPGTIFHRGHDWNTIRDTMPPIYLTRTVIHSRASIKAVGDDAQVAKSGELPPKALVRVDAIRKACLTNLDGAEDCLLMEVEHPVDERPVCNLLVGRGMQAIAGNHGVPQRSLLAHLRNSRHRKRLCHGKVVEGSELSPELPPTID